MELNYAYDELYTKAVINHCRVGYILRFLYSICVFLAFWLFLIMPKDDFGKFDMTITYILLVTSICLDVAATIMLVLSYWMVVFLLNVKKLSNLSEFLAKCIMQQFAYATEKIMKIIISYVQKCLTVVSIDWAIPGHAQLLKFNKLASISAL
ncbi:hypothetical protein IEQ34_008413 [Dendrobium chrysotoxum]|uniref:DUF4220 domain-containing protein n=1 Tax=Dendrobium chrysotoxum TaxID=161865 RepID=A0AAV7GZ72_DENCH|nr:hypothetical protein IEQ34_008413 [Dendrobium chrysotoxum]